MARQACISVSDEDSLAQIASSAPKDLPSDSYGILIVWPRPT